MAATVNLVVYLDKSYGVDSLGGHNDYEQAVGSNTECPGINAMPFVNELKLLIR
jgi:hypothetical protein